MLENIVGFFLVFNLKPLLDNYSYHNFARVYILSITRQINNFSTEIVK